MLLAFVCILVSAFSAWATEPPAELRAVWLQGPFPAVADWCASQALPDCGPDPARGEASRRGAIDRITAVRATDGQGTRVGFAVHTTQGWFVADIAEYVQTDGPNRVQARLDVARPGNTARIGARIQEYESIGARVVVDETRRWTCLAPSGVPSCVEDVPATPDGRAMRRVHTSPRAGTSARAACRPVPRAAVRRTSIVGRAASRRSPVRPSRSR
jgi:hypothetical protein